MTHIRNRQDIKFAIEDERVNRKRLPNFFDNNDELSHITGFSLSLACHILFILIMVCMQTFVFSHLPKPELPTRDVEFKLVEAESKPPINKNTKVRSDRDSRAGGKHDSKKAISEPGKTAPKKEVKKPTQPKAQTQKTIQNIFKPQPQPQKTAPKPQVKQQPQPQVKKPSSVSAPSVAKPSLNPVAKPQGVPMPSAPKIATAPKSPFNVPVAPNNAPVGSTYKPQGASSSTGSKGTSGNSGATPAPKFSTSSGSSGGSSGSSSSGSSGSYASRGSGGGLGQGNNPGPGNPNGTPGIDAIRQPNWGPYMRDLEQRIKRNWSPPKGDSSKRVVITFTIGRDGRLISRKITKSSGVPLADQAALHAIEATAPFKPLPPEYKGTSVPIEFTFDYNVLNGAMR